MSESKRDMRAFRIVQPTADDLAKASVLPRNACPRRYCWWWPTLAFDWNTTPQQGCTFLKSETAQMRGQTQPCCRCDANSKVDHFEARGPHMLEDGFNLNKWDPRTWNGYLWLDEYPHLENVLEKVLQAFPYLFVVCEHPYPFLHRMLDVIVNGQAYRVLRCTLCEDQVRFQRIPRASDEPGVPMTLTPSQLHDWIQEELKRTGSKG